MVLVIMKKEDGLDYIFFLTVSPYLVGNATTMSWWSDLWLNEGFATFVGWLAVDKIFPSWDVWTQFCTEELSDGLNLDSLRSSHPIEVEVGNPDEVYSEERCSLWLWG